MFGSLCWYMSGNNFLMFYQTCNSFAIYSVQFLVFNFLDSDFLLYLPVLEIEALKRDLKIMLKKVFCDTRKAKRKA